MVSIQPAGNSIISPDTINRLLAPGLRPFLEIRLENAIDLFITSAANYDIRYIASIC